MNDRDCPVLMVDAGGLGQAVFVLGLFFSVYECRICGQGGGEYLARQGYVSFPGWPVLLPLCSFYLVLQFLLPFSSLQCASCSSILDIDFAILCLYLQRNEPLLFY